MEFEINNKMYEVIKNNKDGFNIEDIQVCFTDYFEDFDYILGDYAYGKLRLKGFYNKDNKKCKAWNCYDDIDEYIEKQCAYGCKYYILKKK